MRNPFKVISEQVVQVWNTGWPFTGLRSTYRAINKRFWVSARPKYEGSIVNYEKCRALYRNFGDQSLGGGFCKPLVDIQVQFIGIPRVSTDDDERDDYLNECLRTYWIDEIQQLLRDSLRDSKTIVRIGQPDLDDPLMTLEEKQHCVLEVLPPERVEIEYNPANKRLMERAIVQHHMVIIQDVGDPKQQRDPIEREIDVVEIVTRDRFRFFNKTDNVDMPELSSDNRWGFVPFLEIFNEWDTTMQGGQSEFEPVLPFVEALNDVVAQGLQAHKYHSIPKVKFNIKSMENFIKNNWPEAYDAEGKLQPHTKISWRGKEILFFAEGEDAEFLEARSVLGDTKTLAEFIIDLICVVSETPEWAFMRVDVGQSNSDQNAQTLPFLRKIERKRNMYGKFIQELLKMALVIVGDPPVRAKLAWEVIRAEDQVTLMQAMQQLIMGLEVAAQRNIISDETYREMLRTFLPVMKNPTQEEKDAQDNFQLMPMMPQAQEPSPNGKPANVPAISGGPQGKNE
jgi:hypothetical protein